MPYLDRRRFLQLSGLGAVAVLSGCVSPSTVVTPMGSIPDPTGALITRWRADRFAKGSYSYLSPANRSGDRELLAAPVGSALFFAGEATSSSNPATVHGALMSGQDAADQIAAVAQSGASIGVIGAGAAGIAAARQLTDEGFDVVIYEARDRIGGRVLTDTSLGAPLDLGASWIQGVNGNPMAAIADNVNAPMVTTNWEPTRTYDDQGNTVPDTFWAAPTRTVNNASRKGQTMQQAMDEALDGRSEEYASRFNFAVVATFEHEYAADVVDLAAEAPHEGDYFGGRDVLL
ncbi:MAG: FAD-dependent oxidoreductase, partial [Acidimicrobiia bacterium]